MRIVDVWKDDNETYCTIELEEDIFVDIKKCEDGFCYVMQCEDGYETYNNDGNTIGYYFDENKIIDFVREI